MARSGRTRSRSDRVGEEERREEGGTPYLYFALLAALIAVGAGFATVADFPGLAPSHKSITLFENGEHEGGVLVKLTPEMCDGHDLGEALSKMHSCTHTAGPPVPGQPHCKAFTEIGQRVLHCSQLTDGSRLYLVPPDRQFMWPTIEIGRNATIPHVTNSDGEAVVLETLSHSPRVFRVYNFMTDAEADQIKIEALDNQAEEYRLKRSTTGTNGGRIATTRTSENAFVTATQTAKALKRRVFDLLGIEQYVESWADGLQVLRYNVSTAYIGHLDYLDPVAGDHDFDSANLGTNRFATVVLYFSDVEEGGQTVFTHAPAPGIDPPMGLAEAKAKLRKEDGKRLAELGIEEGSWEETLVAQCRSNLAVEASKGAAVLFYSQHADGRVDEASNHGACPVLAGQKWAANLWVWNGARYGMSVKGPDGRMTDGVPESTRQGKKSAASEGLQATFRNYDVEGATLFYDDSPQPWLNQEWSTGQVFSANTYPGHRWVVRVGSAIIKEWVIEAGVAEQEFVLSKAGLE
ncbi:unnamed protein product [Chrysoparadoxa australica]